MFKPTTQGTELHVQQGLHFSRMSDGSVCVRVEYIRDGIPVTFQSVVIPEQLWASIVAHCADAAESPNATHWALALHRGEVPR